MQIEEEFLTVLMDTTDSKNAVDFDRLAAQVVFSVLDYLSCWLSQKRKMFTSSMPQADIKKNKSW